MMRSLLLLALLSAFSAGLAATTTRWCRILDTSGQPIAGALITDGLQQVFSADDGSFYFYTAADSLTVQRLGYKPRRVAFRDLDRPVVLQAEVVQLPRIVVTASAWDFVSTPPDRIVLPVDPDRHYYSAGDMLSAAAAAHSNDVRLQGEIQNISLLGNLARHSLILLDGVPLNPDGGSCDLSLLDPANIGSIELIQNNASVYGGGSAIGGVVRITSRKRFQRSGEQVSLSTELGSFGYGRVALGIDFSRPQWQFRCNFSKIDTDNDFRFRYPDWWAADSSAVRENNAKRQNSLSASGSWHHGQLDLTLQSDYSSFMRQLPGTINFAEVYRLAYLEGWANRNHLTLDLPLGNWQHSWLAWLKLDNTLYDNTRAPLPVFVSRNRQKMSGLGLRGNLGREFTLSSTLRLNGGIYAEAGSSRFRNLDLLNPAQNLDHRAPFANAGLRTGLEMDFGLWTANTAAAIRYDHNDDLDNLSWRLEGSLRHFGYMETTLGATLGTSFALPSPYNMWWRGDSQTIGNPDLKSELSRGWQFWLANALGPFRLKAGIHHNEIENLIQWRQVQMFGIVWKPLNIGRARIRNLELEASAQPWPWLMLSTTALLTDAKDLSSLPAQDAPTLMYTPDLSYAAELKLAWRSLNLWTRYNYTGKQWSTPDNLADPLQAYDLLEAGLSWTMAGPGWTLMPQLSIRNILNKRYEIYAYVPQPGISFYGGLSLSLNP